MSIFATPDGQRFLAELIAAFDALPEPRLIWGLWHSMGDCCAVGAWERASSPRRLSPGFDDPFHCAAIIENDSVTPNCETPEGRWTRMRAWAISQLAEGWPQDAGGVTP